jgi:hypothetical protein
MNNQREERVYNLAMEYSKTILEKWLLIIQLNEEVHENAMYKRKDINTLKIYINKLFSLYIEIYPKVETRTDIFTDDFIDKYKAYKEFYTDRDKVLEKENINKIYEIQDAVGHALATFGILDFER